MVDNEKIIDGSAITVGDQVIGIASSGLHSNGYSLARKVFLERMGLSLDAMLPDLDAPLGEVLLTPTRIYVKTILNLLRDFRIKGMAHITGGGITENVPRVLPRHCRAIIDQNSWPKPAIFEILRQGGDIEKEEMYRTFNYGIGMVLIVPQQEADDIMVRLHGLKEQAFLLGEIAKCDEGQEQVTLV